jgi:hypothetical protein
MVKRCEDPKSDSWKYYGGAGVKIENLMWHDFKVFLRDMGACPEGMTLNRKDNSHGYCKDNCEWATSAAQAINRKTTILVEVDGQKLPLKHAAKLRGLPYSTVQNRLLRGWPMEKALTKGV